MPDQGWRAEAHIRLPLGAHCLWPVDSGGRIPGAPTAERRPARPFRLHALSSCTNAVVDDVFSPESDAQDPEGRDIINPFTINEKRLDLTCSLCNKPGGACIQCKAPRCLTAFHASCARNHGVYMAEKEKIKDGEEYVDKLVLCDKHKPTDGSKKKRRKREIKW